MAQAGPQLSYATVISSLGFAGAVVYGIWALNQSQLGDIKLQLELIRKDTDAKDVRLATELSRRETELRTAVTAIDVELGQRRKEFVGQPEFIQHQAHTRDDIAILRDQLKVLEQSRPNTGELQATANALRDRIDKLYEQVKAQEDWIRTHQSKQP